MISGFLRGEKVVRFWSNDRVMFRFSCMLFRTVNSNSVNSNQAYAEITEKKDLGITPRGFRHHTWGLIASNQR